MNSSQNNSANQNLDHSPQRPQRSEGRPLSQDEGDEMSNQQQQMAAHVYSKLQMMTDDDEREILQRVLKESLNINQSVSQSTDRISLAQFNTFSQQYMDQHESPIKVPMKIN
jgi:hypothetical protein